MALLQLLLLLGTVGIAVPHLIFKEPPPRFQISRIAFNEWRPIRQTSGQIMRYPVFKKVYSPTKKDVHQHDLAVDGSEQVIQHYSSAPPSILGSLSVFGHATVKARQHATHMPKNPRPLLDTHNFYQAQHKHVAPYLIYKDPPKRPNGPQVAVPFRRQPFYSDERSPNSHFQQAQSTSLASNTYYFEQQPPFIPSTRDHSFEKVRKPSSESFNLPYSIAPLDYQGIAFYSPNSYQDFYSRNPFGDIRIDEVNRNPVQINATPEPVDPLYESVPLGKPFHGGLTSTKSTETFSPIVTTYSSLSSSSPPSPHPSKLSTIKFSQVAQPFQSVTPKPKIENVFTESVYPLPVTTVDGPDSIVTDKGTSINASKQVGSLQTIFSELPPVKINRDPALTTSRRPQQAPIVTYEQPFLPTPSSHPWSLKEFEENNDELTTQQQAIETTVGNGAEDETWPASVTTVTIPIETTTAKKVKSRRRPQRRPSGNKSNYEKTEESTTTSDYSKFNRRRKPVNKDYTSSELKRPRTSTTTTTVAPILEDTTEYTTEMEYITEPIVFTSIASQNIEQDGQDSLNIAKLEETTSETLRISSSSTEALTPTSTISGPTLASKMRIKYGSRPRFSVKDYRERLRTTSTTSAPGAVSNKTESKTKQRIYPTKDETSNDNGEVTSEPKYKYKPRVSPLRYKTSTTTIVPLPDTTTTEKTNSFRPNSNRYKSSGGKYFSRYRTSTTSSREVEEILTTPSSRMTMKTKGVFSAKRRPFPLKQKGDVLATVEDTPTEILKVKDNEVIPSLATKSLDDVTSMTTVSYKEQSIDPTGEEAIKIADLTSSSSNEFHHTSSINKFIRRRPPPNISIPRDDPILPLEAFFQTQSKE